MSHPTRCVDPWPQLVVYASHIYMSRAYLPLLHEVGDPYRGGGVQLPQSVVGQYPILPQDGYPILSDAQHQEF